MKKITKKTIKATKPMATISSETVTGTPHIKHIGKIEIDLGRGDLNLMRDKINEIIEKHNDKSI